MFEQLCADVAAAFADGGLHAWDGAACAQLCRNAGLAQYAEAFGSNLTGEKLGVLRCSDLPLLGPRLCPPEGIDGGGPSRRQCVRTPRRRRARTQPVGSPSRRHRTPAARPSPRPVAAHSPPGKGVRRPAAPEPSAAADGGGDGGIGESLPELRATVKAGLARRTGRRRAAAAARRRGRRGRRATRCRLRRRRSTSCGWGLRRAARRSPTCGRLPPY